MVSMEVRPGHFSNRGFEACERARQRNGSDGVDRHAQWKKGNVRAIYNNNTWMYEKRVHEKRGARPWGDGLEKGRGLREVGKRLGEEERGGVNGGGMGR